MKLIKTVFLSLILIITFAVLSKAAEQDSSLLYRGLRQQIFTANYIKEKEPPNGFKTDVEVLSFMQELSNSWAKNVSNQSEQYKNLDIYCSMWAIYTLFQNELPSGTKCLIFSEIGLPSFLSDIEYLEEQLNREGPDLVEAAYLIRKSSIDWAASQEPTFICNLDFEKWNDLKDAIVKYPDIIQQYLDSDLARKSINNKYYKSIIRVQSTAKKYLTFLELLDKIYKSELNNAFANLAAEIPQSQDYLYVYVFIGKQLFEKLLNNNQTDLAFATLDLLARNVSNETLSRNELKTMYLRVDPEKGFDRFNIINNTNISSSLIKSQKHQNFSFDLLDARSNQQFSTEAIEQDLIVLDFWSISCKPCIEKIPNLNQLTQNYKDRVILISVNSDLIRGTSLDILRKFIQKKRIEYPVLVDTEESNLMEKYSVNGWPVYFLVDKEGYYYQDPVEKRIRLSIDEIDNYLKNL